MKIDKIFCFCCRSLCERIEQGVNMSPLGDRPTQEDRDSYYKDCEEVCMNSVYEVKY